MKISPEHERSAPRQGDAPSSEQAQGQPTASDGNINQYSQVGTEVLISSFSDAFQEAPDGQTTLAEFISDIQSGTHSTTVERVRAARAEGETTEAKANASKIKKELPAVSISGLVAGGKRKNAFEEGRFRHSGLLYHLAK